MLTTEVGVAEVLVTARNAWILTDEIEAERLQEEELPAHSYELYIHPWAEATRRESFVKDVTEGGRVLSDRPGAPQNALPLSLLERKRVMGADELERYRRVGRLASEAMSEALFAARPTWTERDLAAAGARALWTRGLHPALTLAAGERRQLLYRHPTPTGELLGSRAMLVFCARKHGLYANLTRFVSFGPLPEKHTRSHQDLREIEAGALALCRPEADLSPIYWEFHRAYVQYGYPDTIRKQHQGGLTGYLAREVVVGPQTPGVLVEGMVVAWNPSLPEAKIEDTFAVGAAGLENLTHDPNWPCVQVAGRPRPLPLERT